MNCFLYQLQFNTAVHFGSSDSALSLYSSETHFRADTLFSALCHTALQLEGESGLNRLVKLVSGGELLLSDGMPWAKERYYLPKPVYSAHSEQEVSGEKRKAMKKLTWIPACQFDEFCASLKSGAFLEMQQVSFGRNLESVKATVPEKGDAVPYQVGLYQFLEDCGLYFVAEFSNLSDSDWFSTLVHALGLSGIGGKVSAGYGKFQVYDEVFLNEFFDDQTEWLYSALTRSNSRSMTLTTGLPTDEELDVAMEGAYYQLVRRSGFVSSDTYAETQQRKQTQYFFGAGSVFQSRFSGALYNVGSFGSHPVYRYAKPVFMGVEL